MASEDVTQLTQAQCAALRLVFTRHNSKEIAAILGVSPSAIDKRLERAVQILGVSTRFEAARMLDAYERGLPNSESDPVVPVGDDPPLTGAETYERLPSEPIDLALHQSEAPRERQSVPWGFARRILGLPLGDGSRGMARNRLSKGERLIQLFGLIGVIAITTMAIVNMAATVTSLLRQNRMQAMPTHDVSHAMQRGGEKSYAEARS